MLVNLKIVPDAEPNADGRWIEARVPDDLDFHTMMHMVPVDGHHVVAIEKVQEEHSMVFNLADSYKVYQFRMGWLRPLPPAELKKGIRDAILDCGGLANDASTSKTVQAIFDQVQRFSVADLRRRVRHVKRGSTYRVIGEAEVRVSTGYQETFSIWRRLHDGDRLTVYQGEADKKLFVRFCDEFNDGRFEDAV